MGSEFESISSVSHRIGDPTVRQLDTITKSEDSHGLYVREYPVGLDAETEDRPTTWFLGRSVLR